jgi:hypothetical protein
VLFQSYLSGDSLVNAARKAGLTAFHAEIGKMLRNARYLGDGYYPAIIDPEIFAAAEAERAKRAKRSSDASGSREKRKRPFIPPRFACAKERRNLTTPFEQAEYAYSLIEKEVEEDGCQ